MKEKIKTFIEGFLNGMTNEKGGHSMKKWLAVGFFWLACTITIRYTTDTNLIYVLGAVITAILTLMGINQLGKQTMKKLDQNDKEPTDSDKPTDVS